MSSSSPLPEMRVPAVRTLSELQSAGVISELAARLLTAALDIGRNVLVVGPWLPSAELILALASDGGSRVVLGRSVPAPDGWQVVGSAVAARALGATRLASYGFDCRRTVRWMGHLCGVAGWLDARRVDQALVRLERMCGRYDRDTTLSVLATVDLVVLVQSDPDRVTQVVEIQLAGQGYRPMPLFLRAAEPPALVPVALPSLLEQFGPRFSVLVDDLRHAMPPRPARAPEPVVVVPERLPPEPLQPTTRAADDLASALRDSEPPGWELEHHGGFIQGRGESAEFTSAERGESPLSDDMTLSAEDADLAAAYGLGPPPPPASAPAGLDSRFSEALRRARARDSGDE